jgi:predicted transcriptional regulator of viral defense system
MKTTQALKLLNQWDTTGRYVYLKRDLRKIIQEPQHTFDATISRLVQAGILERAAHGIYVYALSRHADGNTLDLIARNLRRGEITYESYESALSEFGVISQNLIDRRTYATTGKSGEYHTSYGVAELTHTKLSPAQILPGLIHITGRGVPMATKQLAYQNLKATRRNLSLIDYEELAAHA